MKVAVCIPAYDEVDELIMTCRSVLDSGHPREDLDLIVAVDGASSRVVAAAESVGARVVTLPENMGSYAARNAAVAAVGDDAQVVLFTDAGCVVTPGWIDEHQRVLRESHMSGGAVRFTHPPGGPTPAGWVDSIRHLKQEVYVSRDRYAATCNLAVRREVLRACQFDPTLRTGGDAEFCIRAGREGFSIAYAPDAAIEHAARSTRAELLTKVRRICAGVPRQWSRWVVRPPLPRPRLTGYPFRLARSQGLDVSLWWGFKASVLDHRCNVMIFRAVRATLKEHASLVRAGERPDAPLPGSS